MLVWVSRDDWSLKEAISTQIHLEWRWFLEVTLVFFFPSFPSGCWRSCQLWGLCICTYNSCHTPGSPERPHKNHCCKFRFHPGSEFCPRIMWASSSHDLCISRNGCLWKAVLSQFCDSDPLYASITWVKTNRSYFFLDIGTILSCPVAAGLKKTFQVI